TKPLPVAEDARVAGPVGSTIEVTATARGQAVGGDVVLHLDGDNAPPGRVALEPRGGQWVGRFPLERGGRFRIELRNELGLTSTEMQPREFVAVGDEPPQVVLKRPGKEVVRGTVGKELLEVEVADDFGLAELALVTQVGEGGDPV